MSKRISLKISVRRLNYEAMIMGGITAPGQTSCESCHSSCMADLSQHNVPAIFPLLFLS